MEKELLSPKEVQDIFNVSRPTEISWRKTGILPKPIVLGRRVYYSKEKINALIGASINQNK